MAVLLVSSGEQAPVFQECLVHPEDPALSLVHSGGALAN
jgi:hypothetical protein